MISNEQLAQKAQNGAQDALLELWQQNKGLINKYAMRYARTASNNGLELEDLKQTGFIALHDAAMSYDHTRGAFSSWLSIHLKGYMLRACGLRHGALPPSVASLDAPVADDGDGVLLDTIEDKNAQRGFRDVLARSCTSCLQEALDKLPGDERRAICAVYFENVPRQEVLKPFLRGMRKLRNNNRLHELLEDYESPIWQHTTLTSFKRTGASSVERAAIRREDILTRCNQSVQGK